jgi:predicted secreted acid phosphatase
MTLFAVDIDGTIVDASARFAAAGKEPSRSNKAKYTEWLLRVQNAESLASDKPVPGMLELLWGLANNPHARVVYLTAREEQWREVTTEWLARQGFPMMPIVMRQQDDWRSSGEYKAAAIDEWANHYKSIVVIDDDPNGDIERECAARRVSFLKSRTGTYGT